MADFQSIKVKNRIQETNDCVTLMLDIPSDKKDDFTFIPGQYLTVKSDINGEDVRRAYSICTSPLEEGLGISVKEVPNGKMSTYLNNEITEGKTIDVMKPDGRFILNTKQDIQRDHFFFAAGSGITPIMSMIKTLLEKEPKSSIYLMYGNRDENNIIFKEQLTQLQSTYNGQFHLDITLSKPITTKGSGLIGLLGKKSSSWKGLKGRIDTSKVVAHLNKYSSKSGNNQYYICGPGTMIDEVKSTLLGNEVSEKDIHQEYFTGGDSATKSSSSANGAKLIATLKGEKIILDIPSGKTVLDTMIDAGHDAPYSCTSGACSTCMAKVTKGTVEMDACFALDDDEVTQGYILTCQAHPTSSEVEIDFDA